MSGKYLIENDWYLIADEMTWNVGKRLPKPSKDKEFYQLTYHTSAEKALRYYLALSQRESVRRHADGTLKDCIDILSAENERLQRLLISAFSLVCDVDLERPADML